MRQKRNVIGQRTINPWSNETTYSFGLTKRRRLADIQSMNVIITIERFLIMTAQELRRRYDLREGHEEFAILILRVMDKKDKLHAAFRR